MGGRGEEAIIGRVTAVDVGVRDAREDAEILAMSLQELEIWRGLVVLALAGREEVLGDEAEVITDSQHTSRLGRGGRGGGEGGCHRVEHRQGEEHAGTGQKTTSGDGTLVGDVGRVGWFQGRGHGDKIIC